MTDSPQELTTSVLDMPFFPVDTIWRSLVNHYADTERVDTMLDAIVAGTNLQLKFNPSSGVLFLFAPDIAHVSRYYGGQKSITPGSALAGPWYRSLEGYTRSYQIDVDPRADINTSWEGIGEGFFYSVLGGGTNFRPTTEASKRYAGEGESIANIFNGDFEASTKTVYGRFPLGVLGANTYACLLYTSRCV